MVKPGTKNILFFFLTYNRNKKLRNTDTEQEHTAGVATTVYSIPIEALTLQRVTQMGRQWLMRIFFPVALLPQVYGGGTPVEESVCDLRYAQNEACPLVRP